MKKVFLAALLLMFLSPVYAEECQCDGREIVKKIRDVTWAGAAKWDFAAAIYNVKDDNSFKSALKYYIENNCTVQNSRIICR